jgi:hypothetical protein
MNTKKVLIVGVGVVGLLVLGFFAFNSYIYNEKQADVALDPKNAEYMIEGERVKLVGGVAESEFLLTKYFGNELTVDLNDDGREDKVFLLTQESSGSGIFYYAVAALNTEGGYLGSDGYFLGDRIAPQTTEVSQNPRHKNVVVVNYADRLPSEPMSTRPSLAKSAYLKLDPMTRQWGIVEPNFEGEAR